jgi:hypothetical protein
VLADGSHKFAAERLHPRVTDWCCRPIGDIRCLEKHVAKQPLARKTMRTLERAGVGLGTNAGGACMILSADMTT